MCHSDVHLHDGAFELGNGEKLDVARSGHVLGHEILGEVVALGPRAQGVEVGDRLVVYPWIGCGECAACQRGDEHLCTPGYALGIVRPGGFADHVLVSHSRYLFDKGGVADTLSATYACSGLTAFSSLKKVGAMQPLDRLVVIGAGGVGLMAIQIALSVFGIQPVVVDRDEGKLLTARRLGVEHTFLSSDTETIREIRKITGGAFAALDYVGAESSVRYALGCLRKGGKLIIVGLYGGSLNIPIPLLPLNARVIQGSYVGSLSEMDELMRLVREQRIAPIEIHERPLGEATEALADLKAGKVIGRQVLVNA